MQIWLVRHAIAVEPAEFAGTDPERPLTARGRKRFRSFVRFLANESPAPDRVVSSPLVRAVQTAQLLARGFGIRKKLVSIDETAGPGCTARNLLELAFAEPCERLAIVGHQPDLATCLADLVGGGQVAFGKGWVAAVELKRPSMGSGHLLWFVGPRFGRE